jgi:hypothetical protein
VGAVVVDTVVVEGVAADAGAVVVAVAAGTNRDRHLTGDHRGNGGEFSVLSVFVYHSSCTWFTN